MGISFQAEPSWTLNSVTFWRDVKKIESRHDLRCCIIFLSFFSKIVPSHLTNSVEKLNLISCLPLQLLYRCLPIQLLFDGKCQRCPQWNKENTRPDGSFFSFTTVPVTKSNKEDLQIYVNHHCLIARRILNKYCLQLCNVWFYLKAFTLHNKARLLFLKSLCPCLLNDDHSVPGKNTALPEPLMLRKGFSFLPDFETFGFSPVSTANSTFSEQHYPLLGFKYGGKRN